MSDLSTIAAATVLALTGVVPAGDLSPVVGWEMNEAAGDVEMADALDGLLAGDVGADVRTGARFDGAVGYLFASVEPDALPVRPGHTVVVPDDRALDPRGDDFAVELRLRTTAGGGNVVQKGQSASPGGYWKIELNDGQPTCLFRGPDGTTNAVRARNDDVTDGAWHTVRCERTDDAVDLWVDGDHVGRNTGVTGRIGNASPVSIGGKQRCDQVSVGCDYFSGQLDYIRISRG